MKEMQGPGVNIVNYCTELNNIHVRKAGLEVEFI
jgi:hypothetical protein